MKIAPERIEALVPEFLVMRKPHGGLLHRLGRELAAHHAAFLFAQHQPGILEHAQVFHETRQRHAMRLRKLGHSGRAAQQALDNAAPRRIGKRPENAIERLRRHPCPIGSGCNMETRFFSVS